MIILVLLLCILLVCILITRFNKDKKKINKTLCLAVLLNILIIILFGYFSICTFKIFDYKKIERDIESDKYFLVISNGGGEILISTYVFLEDDSFRYVIVRETTKCWGCTEWERFIEEKGNVKTSKELINISKKYDSFGYIVVNKNTIGKDGKKYEVGAIFDSEEELIYILENNKKSS